MSETTETPRRMELSWLAELNRIRRCRAAHFFLLHFNVSDYAFDGQPPLRLTAYLERYLGALGCERIARVSLSAGVRWIEVAAPGEPAHAPTPADAAPPQGAERSLRALEGSARAGGYAALRALEADLLRRAEGGSFGVIIENVDHLAPRANGSADPEAVMAAEILTRLAVSDRLRAAGVVIIGLCRSLDEVANGLLEAAGGVADLRIPLPDRETRLAYLQHLQNHEVVRLAPLEEGLSVEAVANQTQGLSIAAIDSLNRYAIVRGGILSQKRIREAKGDAIDRQSRGLLEEIPPRHGLDRIGGLEYIVAYLRDVVGHLRDRRLDMVPKGILLAGPPGTGKTVLAEALAREAGFNLVRMGDIRSMWVGESERNLSHVLTLLLELEPVVVFVDEIDQALGSRDEGQSGDSGVSGRMFGRILNFMADNQHRGRVLWVAATNRPDLLDEATRSRFDRIFPVTEPTSSEREKILRVMPAVTNSCFREGIELAGAVAATEGLTGRAIEVVVRRAAEIASAGPIGEEHLDAALADYKPNHDPDVYRLQSLLAIQFTNLLSCLPAEESLSGGLREIVQELREKRSSDSLRQRIRELQERIQMRR